MMRFGAICRTTFLQTIRQPIYFVLTLVTLAVLVLIVPITGWTMGSDYHTTDQRMLEGVGLSTLLMAGLLISVFSASSVLFREIEDRTALTVISKPVSRATFLLGKFGGVAAAVLLAVYLASLVFLLTVRHKVMPSAADELDMPVLVLGISGFVLAAVAALLGNLFFGWPFTSAWLWSALALMTAATGLVGFIGKGWVVVPFGEGIRAILVAGVALVMMGTVVLCAAAVTFSARVNQLLTLVICIVLFAVGSKHPELFGRHHDVPVVHALGYLVPDLSVFEIQEAVTNYEGDERSVSWRILGLAMAYCGLYVAGLLCVGVAIFQRRELEAEGGSSNLPVGVWLLAWSGRALALGAAFAAFLILSARTGYAWRALLSAGQWAAAGAGLWIFWGYFSRGARWSWYLALGLLAAGLGLGLVRLLAPHWLGMDEPGHDQRLFLALGCIVLAVGVGLALTGRTRRHFVKPSLPAGADGR